MSLYTGPHCMYIFVITGPHRMRKKMCRNELFYVHYPFDFRLEHSQVQTTDPLDSAFHPYYPGPWSLFCVFNLVEAFEVQKGNKL